MTLTRVLWRQAKWPFWPVSQLLLIMVLSSGFSARGSTIIDVREINALSESLVVDSDVMMLGLRFGADINQVLTYRSWVGPDGWSGILEGTLLGEQIHIDYEGYFTPGVGPFDPATIAYTSTGTWRGETWSGEGSGSYIDPEYGYQISPLEGKISGSISGTAGVFNLSVTGSKDFVNKELRAEVAAGVIGVPHFGNLFEAGGGFRLHQNTGKDESFLFTREFFGLFEQERVVDRTRIWRPSSRPPHRTPPPPISPPRHWPPSTYEESHPDIPPGGSPGFDPSDVSSGAYHSMYVGSVVPEPSAIVLWMTLGFVCCAAFITRANSRRARSGLGVRT